MEAELDKQQLDRDLARFSTFVKAKAYLIKKSASGVMKAELRRLVKTLLNVTPAARRDNIERDVKSQFAAFDRVNNQERGWSAAGNDVHWLVFSPNSIFGVAPNLDATSADVAALEQLHRQGTTGGATQVGQRGKQKVYILRKIVTTAAQVRKLTLKLTSHIGRLKAAWIPAARSLGVQEIPATAARHENNARGYAVNTLDHLDDAAFEMENHAVGAANAYTARQVQAAVKIRMDAIPKRTLQVLRHPELADQDVVE